MERANINGRDFRTAFVLILVVAVTMLFLAVAWPFLKPLLVGAIFSGLSLPLYRWLTKLVRGRRTLAAALTLLLLFLIIAGPISAFLGVVVKQALNVSEQAIPWVKAHSKAASSFNAHDWLVQHFPALGEYVPSEEEIAGHVGAVAQGTGKFLVGAVSRMTAGTAAFLLDFFVMIYAMFFFLRDGRQILEKIFYYIPLNHEDEEQMLERLTSITRATVKGTLIVGAVQGTLAGIAFWVAGVDGAAFWGTVMTVLSIIPGIGAALVWVPAVIYLFTVGQTMPAILLAAWCAAVVGTVDNILRPILVGQDAKMPDLLIFIGTLGGIFLFGPIGFVVGPLVCGLFLTVWEIYGSTFQNALPPVRNLSTGELKAPEGTRVEEKTAVKAVIK